MASALCLLDFEHHTIADAYRIGHSVMDKMTAVIIQMK